MGAIGVAVVDTMIKSLGVAATFLGLALLTAALELLVIVEWMWGLQWRAEKERKRILLAKDLQERRASGP